MLHRTFRSMANILLIIVLLAGIHAGCGGSSTTTSGTTVLKGWELNETNTGLKGDYSKLVDLDLAGADSGKGTANYQGVTGLIHINAGVTIENRIITYSSDLDLTAGGITIKNCLIRPTGVGQGMPLIGIVNGTIEDSELDASQIPAANVYAGFSAEDSQILRCNLHDMSTGIQMYGTSADTLVENCYVHGLRYVAPAHVDGITIRKATGTSCNVINNRVVTDVVCTAALFIQPSAGPITASLRVEGNLFEGSGYTFGMTGSTYDITGTNMSVIDNLFNPYAANGASSWGAVGISNGGPTVGTWSDNYLYDANNSPTYRGAVVDQ